MPIADIGPIRKLKTLPEYRRGLGGQTKETPPTFNTRERVFPTVLTGTTVVWCRRGDLGPERETPAVWFRSREFG